MYYDEFQASHEDSSSAASAIDKMQARRVQIENFDRKVHAHAKTIPAPPSLLKGRVATNKFQTGGKSNSTVQPHGTHEVGNEDTGRMTYGAKMHIWLGEVAKRSTLGHHVHRHAYLTPLDEFLDCRSTLCWDSLLF